MVEVTCTEAEWRQIRPRPPATVALCRRCIRKGWHHACRAVARCPACGLPLCRWCLQVDRDRDGVSNHAKEDHR